MKKNIYLGWSPKNTHVWIGKAMRFSAQWKSEHWFCLSKIRVWAFQAAHEIWPIWELKMELNLLYLGLKWNSLHISILFPGPWWERMLFLKAINWQLPFCFVHFVSTLLYLFQLGATLNWSNATSSVHSEMWKGYLWVLESRNQRCHCSCCLWGSVSSDPK